jgi:hypothetical protein
MKRNTRVVRLAFVAAVFMVGSLAQAAVIGVDLGTGAPPPSLGGFALTAFADDARPLGSLESTVPSPLVGDLGLSPDLTHVKITQGWATWSHGYLGDAYFDLGTTITLTLPTSTGAFVAYAEPDVFGVFDITATTSTGEFLTLSVDGSGGAKGFGFYGDAGEALTSITFTLPVEAGGFALGEFLISPTEGPPPEVPEPGSMPLLALGGVVLAALRRRF